MPSSGATVRATEEVKRHAVVCIAYGCGLRPAVRTERSNRHDSVLIQECDNFLSDRLVHRNLADPVEGWRASRRGSGTARRDRIAAAADTGQWFGDSLLFAQTT